MLELIEEIFVSNILLKGLDVIAEPDSLNKLVIHIVKSHNDKNKPRRDELNPVKKVQVLKHWCRMNGYIFKSVSSIGKC